jgi:hypothetical protein
VPVEAGKHGVRVLKAGLDPVERIVSVASNEHSVIELALPTASRRVDVQSVPSGALVFVDGQLQPGQTPLAIRLTDEDFHELRIEKSGFEEVSRALTPDDRDPVLRFPLTPEKNPVGSLWLGANRSWRVFLDGGDTGFVTPTLGLRVAAGTHVVELKDNSGVTVARAQSTIARGEIVHLELGPSPTEGKQR